VLFARVQKHGTPIISNTPTPPPESLLPGFIGDANATDKNKMPGYLPRKPDFYTCGQNVAAFLAEAATRGNTNTDGARAAPTAEYIYGYMRLLFSKLDIAPECCIYADIYIRRLLSNPQHTLRISPSNWQRILVGACLLASKYVDDFSVENVHFSLVLTGCSMAFVNKLESKLIKMLNWQLYVSAEEFTRRYFDLARKTHRICMRNIDFSKIRPYFTSYGCN